MNYPKYVIIDNEKYNINTDFRIAIKCNEIAMDNSIDDYERALAIIYKLFGEKGLNATDYYEQLLEFAKKYLACGEEIDNKEEPDMDYVQDYPYIKTSFRSDYGIKLDEEKMHWWEFTELLSGLSNSEMGNCCILNRIRNLRNYDVSEIKDKKERNKIIKAKEEVALKPKKNFTKEQQDNINKFYELAGLNRKE